MKFKIALGIVFLGLLGHGLFAQLNQGSGRLKGVVSDEAGKPVAGAQVEVVNEAYNTKFTAVTDAKGRWALSGLASARYMVIVKKAGYRDATIDFQLSLVAQRTQTLDVTLKKPDERTETAIETPEGSTAVGVLQEGNELFIQREYAQALAKFEEYRKANPDIFRVNINIGNCFLAMKDYAGAIKAYEEYIDKVKTEKGTLSGDKDAAKVLATIGQAYMDQGNVDEAKLNFKMAIDSFPGDPVPAYNVAEIYFNQGEPDPAIEYLLIAVKIEENWAPPYRNLGYAYLNKGQYQKALESFKKFLALAPDDPQARMVTDLLPSVERLAKTEKK